MKNIIKGILTVCVLATLSACTGYGVTFQTAPATALSSCHPALVGNWRIVEGERNAPESSTRDFLSVNADCSGMYSITVKKEGGKETSKVDNLGASKDYKIQFSIAADGQDYVVVTPKETSFAVTPDIKLPSGKIIYQINKGKDGVILRSVDLDKTAQLVLQKKISGQIFFDRDNPDSMKTTNVYVRGDEKQIADYLAALDMYSDERLLLVPTSPQEKKLIQTAIRNFGKEKKPK